MENRMFKSLAVAAAAVTLLICAPAQAEDGLALVKNCTSNDTIPMMLCLGYVNGVWDMTVDMQDDLLIRDRRPQNRLCMGDNQDAPKASELRQMWLAWAHRHPENLQYSASAQVRQAFIDAYPCRE